MATLSIRNTGARMCKECGITGNTNFYGSERSMCKQCRTKANNERRRERKAEKREIIEKTTPKDLLKMVASLQSQLMELQDKVEKIETPVKKRATLSIRRVITNS